MRAQGTKQTIPEHGGGEKQHYTHQAQTMDPKV